MKRYYSLLLCSLIFAVLLTFSIPVNAGALTDPEKPFTVKAFNGSGFEEKPCDTLKDAADQVNIFCTSGKDCELVVNQDYTCQANDINVVFHLNGRKLTIKPNSTSPFSLTQPNSGQWHFTLGEGAETGTVITSNIRFVGDSQASSGGINVRGEYTLQVENTSFINNGSMSRDMGGAICFTQGSGSITNAKFDNNTARRGGAIFIMNEAAVSVSIENSQFNGNTGLHGGAVYAAYNSKLTLKNVEFSNNRAAELGGAFSLEQNVELSADKLSFVKNTSDEYGGAIGQSNASVPSNNNEYTFYNSTFKENTATYGGAVYAQDNGINFDNCQFNSNRASFGGAVLLNPGLKSAFTDECRFENNTAEYSGGAIYVNGNISGASLPAADFAGLQTDATTFFSGNKCNSTWCIPPENVGSFTNLKFNNISVVGPEMPSDIPMHIIDNYDIGYYGRIVLWYNSGNLNDKDNNIMKDYDLVVYGEKAMIKSPADFSFVKAGYAFSGWSETPDGSSGTLLQPGETLEILGPKTLYANWNKLFTVTFDSDGGSVNPQPQTVIEGSLAIQPENPAKEDLEFDGWYLGDTKWDFATPIGQSIVLKAHYVKPEPKPDPQATLAPAPITVNPSYTIYVPIPNRMDYVNGTAEQLGNATATYAAPVPTSPAAAAVAQLPATGESGKWMIIPTMLLALAAGLLLFIRKIK